MKAARLHDYGKAPVLEDIPVPAIQPDELLVQVKACGMCRSDVQLVDGYFRKYADIPTPITISRCSREQTFYGSYRGNNTDLSEVMSLAGQDKIRHTIKVIAFDQINEYIDLLRTGDVVGRAVVKF